jgi:hypothetical protein
LNFSLFPLRLCAFALIPSRLMPLLTELGKFCRMIFYKYAAPTALCNNPERADLKSCAKKIVAKRHRKLARHKVPGQPSENKTRPERTAENAPTDSSVLSGRIIFPARIQPLRSWLISAVPCGT